jgi:hypothetical protein
VNIDNILTIYDLLLAPIYIGIIFLIARFIYKKNRRKPIYKYFLGGLWVKVLGAIGICLVYGLYYRGGDTVWYHYSSSCIANLGLKEPFAALSLLFNGYSLESFSCFNNETGYPIFWQDPHTFFLVRLISPIVFISFKSFVCSALVLSFISYSGIWKLYTVFVEEFPTMQKELAISVLFIPSVFFWGSGLLKDTVTIASVGWYVFAFYSILIKKRFRISNFIALAISSYLLLAIKPYIFFALMPGSISWLTVNYAHNIKNNILRKITIPFFIIIGVVGGFWALTQFNEYLGKYSVDRVFEQAYSVQKDLKADYYHGNSFDIGEFDPTLLGGLSKAHLAIAATFFRPYLWDVKNVIMFLSAIENTYILLLTIALLIRLKIFGIFRIISNHPLLFYSIIFALFFGFSVGLATSNFGALVRLKIPCIPFFVSSLFIIRHFYEEKSKKKLGL